MDLVGLGLCRVLGVVGLLRLTSEGSIELAHGAEQWAELCQGDGGSSGSSQGGGGAASAGHKEAKQSWGTVP